MRISAPALIALFIAALLLVGCERAGERREAREAASDATATVEAQGSATSVPVEATPIAGTPAAEATAPPPAASCGNGEPGSVINEVESEGVARGYRLHVPSTYDGSSPAPLVMNFHGFGSSAVEQERYSGIIAAAEQHGFIAATPDGTNRPQRWYIYGQIEPGYVDDVAFVDQLIDAIAADYCVDGSRIYAMGISNGGGMSALLGCRLNHRIAAIAPVAGSPYSSFICRDAGPMPVVAFHGTDDTLVPFEGGPGGRLNLPVNAVRENMRGWAEHNGCNLTLSTERIAAVVVLESYTGCVDGADVHLYVVEGGGHTWPGSSRNIPALGSTTQSISATEVAWRFFLEHPKP